MNLENGIMDLKFKRLENYHYKDEHKWEGKCSYEDLRGHI